MPGVLTLNHAAFTKGNTAYASLFDPGCCISRHTTLTRPRPCCHGFINNKLATGENITNAWFHLGNTASFTISGHI